MLITEERPVTAGTQTTERTSTTVETPVTNGMSTTAGNADISMNTKNSMDTSIVGTPTTEAMPQQNPSNISMILNISGKSVAAGRQATAGTPGVVDTVGKFATGLLTPANNQQHRWQIMAIISA
jgi:hypothetical protein